MKRLLFFISYGLLAVTLAGCNLKYIMKPSLPADKKASVPTLPAYSGPKAKIAVADFDIKAAKADNEIGSGLRQMLITALINSNRFNVIERQAGLETDLIISVTLSEFEPQGSGGRAGIGGGGSASSGILGALLGASLNKAHVALDIRIVTTSTSTILATTRVQGQALDISGNLMTNSAGNLDLASGLSLYANTPMEKAIRICITEAVRYISQAIPISYYKY